MEEETKNCFACNHYPICNTQKTLSEAVNGQKFVFTSGYWLTFHEWLAGSCTFFEIMPDSSGE